MVSPQLLGNSGFNLRLDDVKIDLKIEMIWKWIDLELNWFENQIDLKELNWFEN